MDKEHDKIYNGIKANMTAKIYKAPRSPMEIFMGIKVHKDKMFKRFLLQKNKYVKLIGCLK